MNEIKKIHLGRQPFTISVEAHKLLRAYLEAIEHQVGAKSDVIKEIELRMAELLTERGISGDKVILDEDVNYLKQQLGEPGDFKDDDRDTESEPAHEATKRLYRDPQHAMIAGVCSGLGAYFGIDATIIRLIFIVALFFGGASILVYIVLWLVMPEANSPSERLQMLGKAVTVDSLKELVDRADVKGAANRASQTVGPVIEKTGKILSALIGGGIIALAASIFIALTTALTYMVFHRHNLIAGVVPFPLGKTETVFVAMCAAVVFIISLLGLLIGMAMVRRKWSLPGWITAALIGLLLVASAVGTAAGPDTVIHVRDRVKAAEKTSLSTTAPFTSVVVKGGSNDVNVVYEQSSSYHVGLRYLGKMDTNTLKTSVTNGVLTIDTSQLPDHLCNNGDHGFCLATGQYYDIVVQAPKLDDISTDMPDTVKPVPVPMHPLQPGERINMMDWSN